MKRVAGLKRIWRMYYEGFRDMGSLGRSLWLIVLIKLFVIFAVLRVFFFRPALSEYSSDEEKSRAVIENLIK